ncbi:hypothetical protein BD289DRAFT_486275 [Coniella lustricola]|uniref:Uncharacterized protein n=1 Tax=Coniella lustricola TaxID=2025994 RepID=A0A2T2ZVQ7_9PEZI|nr:hypothetical protein BD289DRAFT_486275 [Coniella lustricola]
MPSPWVTETECTGDDTNDAATITCEADGATTAVQGSEPRRKRRARDMRQSKTKKQRNQKKEGTMPYSSNKSHKKKTIELLNCLEGRSCKKERLELLKSANKAFERLAEAFPEYRDQRVRHGAANKARRAEEAESAVGDRDGKSSLVAIISDKMQSSALFDDDDDDEMHDIDEVSNTSSHDGDDGDDG